MGQNPDPDPKKGSKVTETLIHGFHVLQSFTASEPTLTLGQVASKTGLDTATVFHLVQALVMLGYVERIPRTKRFRLTLKPLELGFHAILQSLESSSGHPGVDRSPKEIIDSSESELLENEPSPTEPTSKSK
jgi:DNA-binding IclR family transcriptional regulator